VLSAPSGRLPISGDPSVLSWYLALFPSRWTHGIFGLVTDRQFAPGAINLMWQNGMPVLAFVMWPVTTAFGPIVTYNVAAVAAAALSAFAAYLVFGRFVDDPKARFVGGLVYGFSAYMTAHAWAHLNLTFAVFPPVALALFG
jgi:hypothetical protein